MNALLDDVWREYGDFIRKGNIPALYRIDLDTEAGQRLAAEEFLARHAEAMSLRLTWAWDNEETGRFRQFLNRARKILAPVLPKSYLAYTSDARMARMFAYALRPLQYSAENYAGQGATGQGDGVRFDINGNPAGNKYTGPYIQYNGQNIPLANEITYDPKLDMTQVVRDYIGEHIGETYTIAEDGLLVGITEQTQREYVLGKDSQLSRRYREKKWKTKAKAVSVIGGMIESATNRGTAEPLKKDHKLFRSGIYGSIVSYTTQFALPNSYGTFKIFSAELRIVETKSKGNFLYDVLNIKTEKTVTASPLANEAPYTASNGSTNNIPQSGEKSSWTEEVAAKREREFADSKVRGEDGKLLPVYHGTDAEYNSFDMDQSRSDMNIRGAFFSPWEDDAAGYGKNVRAFYLNITNPADEAAAYKALRMFQEQNEAGVKARDYLIRQGYDGVNFGDQEYIAFYPEQIKSADDVTYDDNGDPIPPEKRYDLTKNDFRYAIAEDADAEEGKFVEPKEFIRVDLLRSLPDEKVKVLRDLLVETAARSRTEVYDNAQAILAKHGFDVEANFARALASAAIDYVKEREKMIRRRNDNDYISRVDEYIHVLSGHFGEGFKLNFNPEFTAEEKSGSWVETRKRTKEGVAADEAARVAKIKSGSSPDAIAERRMYSMREKPLSNKHGGPPAKISQRERNELLSKNKSGWKNSVRKGTPSDVFYTALQNIDICIKKPSRQPPPRRGTQQGDAFDLQMFNVKAEINGNNYLVGIQVNIPTVGQKNSQAGAVPKIYHVEVSPFKTNGATNVARRPQTGASGAARRNRGRLLNFNIQRLWNSVKGNVVKINAYSQNDVPDLPNTGGEKSSGDNGIRKAVAPVYTGRRNYVAFSDKDIRVDEYIRFAIDGDAEGKFVEPKEFIRVDLLRSLPDEKVKVLRDLLVETAARSRTEVNGGDKSGVCLEIRLEKSPSEGYNT